MRQVAKGANLTRGSCLSSLNHHEGDTSDIEEDEYNNSGPGHHHVEKERKIRREIANSNERRRMQSINVGFQTLRSQLPQREGGEKLSKAAVLQHAGDYMRQVLDENNQLRHQNQELTTLLKSSSNTTLQSNDRSALKRRKRDTESSDEGISMSYQSCETHTELIEELRHEVAELRVQLDRERQRHAFMERSYTYSLMAAQMSQNPQTPHTTTPPTTLIQPTQHTSNLNMPTHVQNNITQQPVTETTILTRADTQPYSIRTSTVEATATDQPESLQSPAQPIESQQTYSKASSVASRNLSIIVEAINQLEGDQPTADKEADSGVSNSESCDEATKSDGSQTPRPLPPPAHQHQPLFSPGSAATQRLLYNSSVMCRVAPGAGLPNSTHY